MAQKLKSGRRTLAWPCMFCKVTRDTQAKARDHVIEEHLARLAGKHLSTTEGWGFVSKPLVVVLHPKKVKPVVVRALDANGNASPPSSAVIPGAPIFQEPADETDPVRTITP